MCEAHAYLLKDGKKEIFLENVDHVALDGDEVTLISIFGEQKRIKARLKQYSGSEGKILLQTVPSSP